MDVRRFDVACTVRISHTFEELSAHVELDGNPQMGPGDRVRVHGEPIVTPPYGQVSQVRRMATVERATWLERVWSRMVGTMDCLSLLEVTFTDRRTL